MKRTVAIVLATLWPLGGAAPAMVATTPAAATMPAPTPELRAYASGVHDPAHARALGLARLDVAVEVRGAVAETTIDAAFANPTPEILEGDFRLALPPGAVVTGYALDVGGRPVEGVLVDRPRARAVYAAQVRRGIDPGVAEVTPDNLFRTSVYPVRPGGGRRVRVRFAAPLPLDGFHLPLVVPAPGEGWSVTVHASGVEAAPAARLAGSALRWTPDEAGYTARSEGRAMPLVGELVVERPMLRERVVSQHRTGEGDIQLGGSMPAGAGADAAPPERLRIYWDRSRARLGGDTAAELDVVRRVIARLRPASVELVAFNSRGAERTRVDSADAAVAWLSAVRYRGATSYAPLARDIPTDHCLLFAHGGPSIDRAAGFAPPCRLDAVSASATADQGWLRHVAQAHGGVALALGPEDRKRVVETLAGPRAGVVSVADQDGRPLPFVSLDAPPGRWLLLARLPAGGPLVVRLAGPAGDAERRVSASEAGEAPAVAFDGAGALLAREQLATLTATEQRADYVALSRRYGVASPSLSFVVLETPADYLAAGIDPPAGYPAEARDDYLRARKQVEASRAEARKRWLDELAGRWAETVAWWNTRFDPRARPVRVATSKAFDRTAPGAPVMEAALAPMEPPPPPAPSQEAPPVVADGRGRDADADMSPRTAVAGAAMAMSVAAPEPARAPAAAAPSGVSAAPAIQIDAWQPDRPYLELYDGRPADFDARFLEAEARHGSLPIFYLDTAEWLRRQGRLDDAREMVLSALELPTANDVTLGIVADRLERYGELDRAIELRERQMALAPARPQPRRLLALALARRAKARPATARADLQRAVGLLYAVATTPLDGPWDGIDTISLVEANALLPRLHRAGGTVAMDPRLVKLLDLDVRVVIDWTTDGSDMDLWVDEPSGERAIYNNPRTAIGGHLSRDMTRGYGPEEYMLHRAPGGAYAVQANVYAPDRLDPNGATLLTAHLFRNFGRPDEQEESIDVEVTRDDKGAKPIGRLEVPVLEVPVRP